jgi:hypothetical protein
MMWPGFGTLSSLVKLQASFNPFTHLPRDMFQHLKELEMFRLAVGKLQHWPNGLAEAGTESTGSVVPPGKNNQCVPRVVQGCGQMYHL